MEIKFIISKLTKSIILFTLVLKITTGEFLISYFQLILILLFPTVMHCGRIDCCQSRNTMYINTKELFPKPLLNVKSLTKLVHYGQKSGAVIIVCNKSLQERVLNLSKKKKKKENF